jgi:LysR family cys regulon transcriptional activator
VSKQVGLLENELGVRIFHRRGKNLSGITPVGEEIFKCVDSMLVLEDKIKTIANEYLTPNEGVLNIYTTHTIARYLLPPTVAYFTQKYPKIALNLQPTLPVKAKGSISKGHSDFSIIAHNIGFDTDLIVLPAYLWGLSLVVPADHPLVHQPHFTLHDLAQYPLLSYEQGSTGRMTQDVAFEDAGLDPFYFMTVMDADVIKRYVELGLGIGIVSSLAANDIEHRPLACLDLSHLFEPSKAWLCFSKDIFLKNYMYDFISSFSPHLTKSVVETVFALSNQDQIDEMFSDISLPLY